MSKLSDLHREIKSCESFGLCKTAIQAVPGEGSEEAEVMFIGEAPGKDEDLQGKPFVGASGKLLTQLIESVGMTREDVYITNVVKWRPPNNRDPLPEEVEEQWPFLERQIKIIKPKVIVTLGRHSMGRFLRGLKISQIHGQLKRASGIWQERQIYLPLYHPAVALYDPRKKDTLFDDFKQIPLILKKLNDPS